MEISREDLVLLMEGGYLYLRMGKFNEAKDVFEGVSVMAPESDVPWVALGSVFFGQHKFDQAIKNYRKALEKKPKSAFAHAYLGESLFFSGKMKEGLGSLKMAMNLDPKGKSGEFAKTLHDAILSHMPSV